jgi:PncC family amidohydrolase
LFTPIIWLLALRFAKIVNKKVVVMGLVQHRIAHLISKYEKLTGTILTLGTVESATGGAISDRITNVPGSSHYYKGSIISYSNTVKAGIVGVKEKTLETHGAVSLETGKEMAAGGRKLLDVDICIADTGIAGPKGATPGKPIGLFYVAMSCSDGTEICREHHFSSNRMNNKKNAACTALEMVAAYIEEKIKQLKESDYPEKRVVTSFLRQDNKVLVLKRSSRVGTYQGHWSAVSGYMEAKPLSQALIEIEEETGLNKNQVSLIKRGKPLYIIDETLKTKWKIYPFSFEKTSPDTIKTDWENIEFRWIDPEEMEHLPTVPGLRQALNRVIAYS